ncbi:hypothetical protein EON80_32645 [bacterium]|nr:MAG: hypothetical protein EON80_32645 [bacterium]
MKTNLLKKENVLQRLNRFPKLLLLAGIAAVMALPQSADARPDSRHGHHHHGGSGGGYYRPSYGPRYSYGPQYRPGPRHVNRGWARPGFYGAYPPAGYVDYRYIHSLPRGYRSVYRDGHRYYYANGSYYWPARYQNSGVFIQVRF